MSIPPPLAVPTAALSLLLAAILPAQISGMRGGVQVGSPAAAPTGPDHFAAEHYITISGRAEVRLRPTSLRVVLAVTSQATTVEDCEKDNRTRQDALVAALAGLGLERGAIHLDFIAMLPIYQWRVEEQSGQHVAVERPSGYRLQTNAHVMVDDEATARSVIRSAFGVGISDVLAVDYWSDGVDQARQQAQDRALREAKRKSDLLLAVFDKRPKPINVHEDTSVRYPKDLYVSFENAYAAGYRQQYGRSDNLPQIAAFRAKNTYYHGFFENADVATPALPMRPEISVVSTVKIYYAAPDRPKGRRKR